MSEVSAQRPARNTEGAMVRPTGRDRLDGTSLARPGTVESLVGAMAVAALTGLCVWIYWPDLLELVSVWQTNDDYSHGFLVVPIALFFLYVRRDKYPGIWGVPGWGGVLLLAVALLVRFAGQRFFLTPLAGWSLILWLGGACWVMGGRRFFYWVLPSLIFLFFMVPLPFQAEHMMSWPLQRMATMISTWMLQLVGQPAVAQGNVILMGAQRLEVAEACSGLRMLIGVTALAVAYGVIARQSWVNKLILLLSVLPVAVFANSLRVAGTGLAMQFVSTAEAQKTIHDVAGWLVIPMAAVMMWMVLTYWNRLFIVVNSVDERDLLREKAGTQPAS